MITSATISHYKSIFETTLDLRSINVIVGPNGSGKSNILDAIFFLHDCAVDDIDTAITKRHGIDSIRQWSRTRPFNITIGLQFSSSRGAGAYRVVIASNKGDYRILEENGSWTGSHPFEPGREDEARLFASFRRDETGRVSTSHHFKDVPNDKEIVIPQEELYLTYINNRFGPTVSAIFQPIARELASFSKYNIYPNTLRNPQVVSKEVTLLEDGSNLASIMKRLNSNKRFTPYKEDMVAGINSLMPNVIDFQVRAAGGFHVPVLRVKEANEDVHDFNLSQISDGTLRTLGLLAAFYQVNAPIKIGIEEPEQMIHPGALPVIYEAMEAFINNRPGGNGRQIFITTHSPTLLDLFEPEDVIWARFRDGITDCGHIKTRQMSIIKQHLFTTGELMLAEGFF